MLLALVPIYALADEMDTAPAAPISKKGSPVTTTLLPAEEVASDLVALSAPPNTIATIFPDPGLAQAVADAFRLPVAARVTQADLDRVFGLEAYGRGITNLAGTQFLRSLQALDLNRNQISDLAPLAGLQNLEILALDDNQISNLQPLAGLVNLEWLWLDDNQISDLWPLAGLNPQWLTLMHNQIESLGPLSGMNRLLSLWLNDNRISDLQPLAGLTQLEGLWLDSNRIVDLRPLAGLVNIYTPTAAEDFMFGLWLGEQLIARPMVMQTNPLVLENPLFLPDGARIAPLQISNNGTYVAPNLQWTGLPANTLQVTYIFAASVTIGTATDAIYGMVVQPLSATPFTDVSREDWFHDAVVFVYNRGIMQGASATIFDPEYVLTRAMVATVLYRMAGEPAVTGQPTFADVPADEWFSNAIVWAHSRGIVTGRTQEIFAPADPITRQEVAVMLHRYAQAMGQNVFVPIGVQLGQFTDRDEIGNWAWEAMRWSVHNEIITGSTPTTLRPLGEADRAECATILMRYIQRFG